MQNKNFPDNLLVSDLVYELKQRAINVNENILIELLRDKNIFNSKDLVVHYGYKSNIYDKFKIDYFKSIFLIRGV